tara:strand:+ start:2995 stop:4194 length:1200 start_codon:yes stop_codon:yes gene_type:complete
MRKKTKRYNIKKKLKNNITRKIYYGGESEESLPGIASATANTMSLTLAKIMNVVLTRPMGTVLTAAEGVADVTDKTVSGATAIATTSVNAAAQLTTTTVNTTSQAAKEVIEATGKITEDTAKTTKDVMSNVLKSTNAVVDTTKQAIILSMNVMNGIFNVLSKVTDLTISPKPNHILFKSEIAENVRLLIKLVNDSIRQITKFKTIENIYEEHKDEIKQHLTERSPHFKEYIFRPSSAKTQRIKRDKEKDDFKTKILQPLIDTNIKAVLEILTKYEVLRGKLNNFKNEVRWNQDVKDKNEQQKLIEEFGEMNKENRVISNEASELMANITAQLLLLAVKQDGIANATPVESIANATSVKSNSNVGGKYKKIYSKRRKIKKNKKSKKTKKVKNKKGKKQKR